MIPPEVKAANRQRALALAAQAPALEDRPPVFAHWMRDVFLPKYRQVMEEQRHTDITGLDKLDPNLTPARDATHFRRIVAARTAIEEGEAELRDAVGAAREAGDSWTIIAAALDTTRQAAYQRFGRPV